MAHLVVGDIHGHLEPFRRLLAAAGLDPATDRLWLVGDLVNRGPDSRGVLRLARELADRMGERFVTVLGNHDLHLLAVAAGLAEIKGRDTLHDVMEAPDRDALVGWLGARPLLHRADVAGAGEHLLVHAGLLPQWSPAEAERRARRAEARLADPQSRRRLLPREAPSELDVETEEVRRDLHVLTLARTLTAGGEMCNHSGPPDEAPDGCLPWFRLPGRRSAGVTVVCGHWAALGLHREDRLAVLDSGCAWNGCLTALRLEDGEVFQRRCRARDTSGNAPLRR